MKKQIKLPAKASAWYVASGILGKACAIVTTPFFTRMLTKEQYGEYNLYMTVLAGATLICSAFNSGSAIYKGLSHFGSKKGGFAKSALTVSLGFTTLICILLFTFSSFLGIKRWLTVVLAAQLLCDSILGIFYSCARYRYDYKSVSTLSVISYILPSALSLTILYLTNIRFGTRIFTLLFVSLFLAGYAAVKLLRGGGKVEWNMMKYSARGALPLLPHSISSSLTSQADKLIITALLGAAALAEYSVAHSVGISLIFLVSTVGGALNPWIIRRLEAGEQGEIAGINSMLFSCLSSAAVAVCALSPEIISILAPGNYSSAASAVMPIALSVLPAFLISTVTVGLIFAHGGKFTLWLSIISGVLCVVLNYMLIGFFGYTGAGYALLISQGLTAVIGIGFLKRLGLEGMVDNRGALSSFFRAAGLSALASLLRPFPALRVLILIVPAIILLNSLFGLKHLVYEKGLTT